MRKKSNRQNRKGNREKEEKYGSQMTGYRTDDQGSIKMINLTDGL